MKLFTNTLAKYKQKKEHVTTFYKLDGTNAIESQLIYSKNYKYLLRRKMNTSLLFIKKQLMLLDTDVFYHKINIYLFLQFIQ